MAENRNIKLEMIGITHALSAPAIIERQRTMRSALDETHRKLQKATNEAMRNTLNILSRKCICCGGPGCGVDH